MKTLHTKIDKSLIAEMPRVIFEGRIIVIISESEAEKAVDYLLSHSIIGIDTETKPSFKKGQHNKVSLLQVSTNDTCFLFRINHIGMPPCIIRLLSDTNTIKIGLSLKDDFMMLHQRANFVQGSFIDLQPYVKTIGIEDMSLQKLYANIFGQKISKSQRLSNWEADCLNEGQQRYAATDAWACIKIYEELESLKKSGNFVLVAPPINDEVTALQ